MASSKEPKTGVAKTAAAPKAPARPKKPAASSASKKVAVPAAEKALPKTPAPAKPAPKPVEPAPTAQAAPQEVANEATKAVQAAVEPAKARNAAQAVVEPVKTTATEAVATVKDVAQAAKKEDPIMETTAKAQAMFADMNDRTKAAVEKSTKMVEEMNDFAKGNVEAMVESSKIAAKGMESFGQDAAEYGRKSFEQATAMLKQMSAAKSPADFFKLQSDFVRSSFDSYVAEASKNTEAMLKLAGDATQPLSNRFAVAAEKVKTAA